MFFEFAMQEFSSWSTGFGSLNRGLIGVNLFCCMIALDFNAPAPILDSGERLAILVLMLLILNLLVYTRSFLLGS